MKHCPACNFTFPDFHLVCDFDGTELVPDTQRQALIKAPPRPLHVRRSLKSLMFLTSLAVLALFLSAVLIGYLQSATQSNPVVKIRPAPASFESATPVAAASDQSTQQVQTPTLSTRDQMNKSNRMATPAFTNMRRQVTASRSVARLDRGTSGQSQSRKSEIARRKDGQQISSEREPKLTAMLKTTWRVLTRPFKF